MFKNLAVGKKIILGFAAVLVLLVAVGLVAFNGLNTASSGFTNYREMARDTNLAGRLQANMLMVRMNVKDFIITGSERDVKQYEEYRTKMTGFLEEAQNDIQDPERAAKIDMVDDAVKDYEAGFKQVIQFRAQRDKLVNGVLNVKGPFMENTLTDIMVSANDDKDQTASYYTGLSMKHLLLARLYMAKFLDANEQKAVDRVHEEFGKMQKNMDVLDKELENPKRRQMLSFVQDAKAAYTKSFDDVVKIIFDRNEIIKGTLDRIGPEVAKNVEDVKLDIKAVQDKLGPQLQASNTQAVTIMTIVGAIALVVGIALSFLISRGITGPLNRIIAGLSEGADQVASASSQVSSASQSLAEGSAEQAASLEETSSSLEEMSSMTKQNADNAGQADGLMKEANQVVNKANNSMTDLTTSMEEISKASEETSKIIKTIDEIAFQTNLLALNAAVEAARAGEAGAGFAVVADEVRNLAMRAADAAKNTADLIEGTVKKVKDGSELVTSTNEAFAEVATSASKVGELVGEIAAASNEQAQGIDQINKAMGEMDKVVQGVAANAEESASASEEMNAQAEQMKGNVKDLVTIVGGSSGTDGQTAQHAVGTTLNTVAAGAGNVIRKAIAAPKKARTQQVAAHVATPPAKEVRPEEVIPMDENEFKDF